MIFALFLLPALAAGVKAASSGVEKIRRGRSVGREDHVVLPPIKIARAELQSFKPEVVAALVDGAKKYQDELEVRVTVAKAQAAQNRSRVNGL